MVSHDDPCDDDIRDDQPRGDAQPREPESAPGPDADGSWLDERYPLVDADFVGTTLDRVLHDRSEIESEAAQVEQTHFAAGFLATYRVPAPSRHFVASTLGRVMAERAAGLWIQSDADFEFRRLIENAAVPDPHPDFVAETLAKVMAERHQRERPVDTPRPRLTFERSRPFSLVASVAAILLCSVVILWNAGVFDGESEPVAPHAAPLGWAALVNTHDPDEDFVLPIRSGRAVADFGDLVDDK